MITKASELYTLAEVLEVFRHPHIRDLVASWMRGSILAREDILLHDIERILERRLKSLTTEKAHNEVKV